MESVLSILVTIDINTIMLNKKWGDKVEPTYWQTENL